MGEDGGTLKTKSTIRLDRTWTLISTFFLSLFFQVPYSPHQLFMVPRALFPAPYENLLSDPLKGSHTKAKSSADARQSIQMIFKDHLFLFRTCTQLSLGLGM